MSEIPGSTLSLTPPEPNGPKPTKRADCLPGGINEMRPCQHMWCKHHLAGKASCSLDVAEEGSHSMDEVAEIMGVSRQRIQQIEEVALFKLKRKRALFEYMKE